MCLVIYVEEKKKKTGFVDITMSQRVESQITSLLSVLCPLWCWSS